MAAVHGYRVSKVTTELCLWATSHNGSMGQTESGDDCSFSSMMTRKEHRTSTDDYTSESSIRRRVEGNRKGSFVAHFMVILLEIAWTPRPGQLLYERRNEHAALHSVGEQLAEFPAHLTNIQQSSATRYWIWLNYRAGRGSRTAAGSSYRSPGVAQVGTTGCSTSRYSTSGCRSVNIHVGKTTCWQSSEEWECICEMQVINGKGIKGAKGVDKRKCK